MLNSDFPFFREGEADSSTSRRWSGASRFLLLHKLALGGDGDGVLHTGSGLDIRESLYQDKLRPAREVLSSSRSRSGREARGVTEHVQCVELGVGRGQG